MNQKKKKSVVWMSSMCLWHVCKYFSSSWSHDAASDTFPY